MKLNTAHSTVKICSVLVIIQTIRILLSQKLLSFIEKTSFTIDTVSMAAMILLTLVILFAAKELEVSFSFLPEIKTRRQKTTYGIVTGVVFLLIASTVFITRDASAAAVVTLVYSTIVTPIFEELIFRGYVWNALIDSGKSEFQAYVFSTILFALWHLGYADVIWLKISLLGTGGNLLFIMLMKVAVGLFFGIIAGFVRYKTKNTYAAMLIHAAMNVFGR